MWLLVSAGQYSTVQYSAVQCSTELCNVVLHDPAITAPYSPSGGGSGGSPHPDEHRLVCSHEAINKGMIGQRQRMHHWHTSAVALCVRLCQACRLASDALLHWLQHWLLPRVRGDWEQT